MSEGWDGNGNGFFFPLASRSGVDRTVTMRQSGEEVERMYQHNLDGYALLTECEDAQEAKNNGKCIVVHPNDLVEVEQ